MERSKNDWRSILLAIGSVGGAVILFSSAALFVVYSLIGAFQPALADSKRTALDVAVLACALVAIGAAFLPAAYYSVRRLRGLEPQAVRPRRMRIWQALVLVATWLAAAFGAQFLLGNALAKWITPALYLLAIGVPVFFFARLAMGGLNAGSRERVWGALASGIGLGIAPSVIAELLLASLGLIGLGIYVAFHPELLSTVQHLATQLQDASSMEEILNLVGPWLNNPIAVLVALAFFSGFSPLIEETAKSVTTWAVFDRLSSPAQGFAIGAMSGAAFGMVESLLVSATPDAGWSTTLLVRGASTMMHIMAASLTGWGIGSFRASRNFARLIGMYVLAIGLHGTWNASVVAITFGSVRTALGSGGPDPIAVMLMFAGSAMLVALCVAIPLALGLINWRLRAASAPSPATILPLRSDEGRLETPEMQRESEEKTSPPVP